MIKRKPKPEAVAASRAEQIVSASHFDHGDGSYQRRAEVIAANLMSVSTVVKPGNKNPTTPRAPKPASAKPKVKQTKRPSQVKAEQEKKAKPKHKVKPGQKSPAAKKARINAIPASRTAGKRGSGGGGGSGHSPTRKNKVPKEHISNRWAKMTPSAKASYIQSKAGKSINTADADEALSKIWSKMSPLQQKAHMRRHPESRLKVREQKAGKGGEAKPAGAKKERKLSAIDQRIEDEDTGQGPGPQDHQPASWWNEQSAEDQQEYLNKYPDSKFSKRHKSVVRNLANSAGGKIKEAAAGMGSDYHHGMQGLKAFRNGEKMTQDQKDGLRRTSIKVGSVLVLAMVGLALFTPLGPAAMEFGEAWYRQYKGQGSRTAEAASDDQVATSGINLEGHPQQDASTAEEHASNEENLKFMTDDMTDFLLKQQDVPAFAKELTKKKAA